MSRGAEPHHENLLAALLVAGLGWSRRAGRGANTSGAQKGGSIRSITAISSGLCELGAPGRAVVRPSNAVASCAIETPRSPKSLGSVFDAWRHDLGELARKRVEAASARSRRAG